MSLKTRLCALGVMIKVPQAGSVKTRLVPPLTNEEAAALSICFFKDTAENIAQVLNTSYSQGVAIYTPEGEEAAFEGLLPDGFTMLLQKGEGFGERLLNAARDLKDAGFESLCLIDADSPTLPAARYEEAIAALQMPGDRVVIGPADDGGYYLIGLKCAHPRLFSQIDWSTPRVLQQTLERAGELGLETLLLEAHYDVDDAAALARLCDELFAPTQEHDSYPAPHTRAFLKQLLEDEDREPFCQTNTPV